MSIQYDEDCEYHFNAQFDYVREAFASTALDPYHEGYCDYLNDCDEGGEKPLDFSDWKASLKTPGRAPAGWNDIPF